MKIGNVGIGTVSSATKLDVNGTAQMTGFKLPAGSRRRQSPDFGRFQNWDLERLLATKPEIFGNNKLSGANITNIPV